jgi:hypothetical protein
MLNAEGWKKLLDEPEWLSECCDATPAWELDMSSVPFGGPSGFCGRCHDNCIFYQEEQNND